jgi:hypothetical protein
MGTAVLEAAPNVEEVTLSMPNLHHVAVDLTVLRDPQRRAGLRRDRQALRQDRGDGAADRGRRLRVSRSFPDDGWRDLLERAHRAADEHRRRFPGDRATSQPLETLYVPADRVTSTTDGPSSGPRRCGCSTRTRPMRGRSRRVRRRSSGRRTDAGAGRSKLERRRSRTCGSTFEDGYGSRPDDEEDRHAQEAARAVQTARTDGTAPASFGLRVKSFADGAEARSLRTLDTFVTTLTEAAGGLPDGFVVTFPKVTTPDHVALFAEALERLEVGLGLDERALRFEVQVETPRSVIGSDGSVAAPRILDAADGRLTAMHFGVFDYTASLGLMPWEQRLDHPANDLARGCCRCRSRGPGSV